MKSPNKRPSRQPNPLPNRPGIKKHPKSKTGGGRWLWLLFGLTGIAMLSATAGALFAVSLTSTPLMQRKLSPREAAVFGKSGISSRSSMQLPELTRPVNILVLGLKVLTTDVENPPAHLKNLRYHALVNSFEGLTDTMLLVRFDPQTKRVVALSIPRDTRTYIDGVGTTKINAANARGGPALSAKATSELLNGIAIDRYVSINVQGVQALVNALGGVTVHVPKDMKYQDDSQRLYVNLKAGKQHLNGDQALQLLRFRHDEYGDIGRIQRQQMVIRSLAEQSLNPVTIARLPKILSVIQSYVDTNLSVEELVALVGFAASIPRSQVQMLMVPGEFSRPGQYDASYWLPHPDRIQTMMAQHFDVGDTSASLTDPANLRIAIQNGTRKTTASQLLLRRLRQAGYDNVFVDDPWSEPLNETRIVAQQGDLEGAEAVQRSLGCGKVRVESTGSLRSDITIQLGKDCQQRSSQPGD